MDIQLCLSIVALACRALFSLQRDFNDLTKSTLVDILVVLINRGHLAEALALRGIDSSKLDCSAIIFGLSVEYGS